MKRKSVCMKTSTATTQACTTRQQLQVCLPHPSPTVAKAMLVYHKPSGVIHCHMGFLVATCNSPIRCRIFRLHPSFSLRMSAILNAKHGNHVVAGLLAPDEVPAPSPSTASKAMPLQAEARAGDDKPSKVAAALSKPASAEEARKVHQTISSTSSCLPHLKRTQII